MKNFYFLLVLFLSQASVFGQGLVYNNGREIYVTNGALVVVKTGSLINNLNGNAGFISNNGLLIVEGDIQNNGLIKAANDSIKLTGDWINNDSYTANNSWVTMYGADQLITGTSVTTFNNLQLLGTAAVKRQTLNSITTGLLVLNDAELATDSNQMLVTNPDTGSITLNSGFVSSVDTGNLARVTNSVNGYLFPTGSPSYLNGPSIYRPVNMAPASANNDIYAAALVKGNPTDGGYDTASLDSQLCSVNPNFYHHLYHYSGSDAAALTMYYDPVTDGPWNDNAHWQNNIWNYLATPVAGSGYNLSSVTVDSVNNFVPSPFALAQTGLLYNPGPTVTIAAGQSVVLTPLVPGPNGANYVWTPDSGFSCTNCDTPTVKPQVTTHYTVTVSLPGGGCSVTDTLDVIVYGQLVMPNAFTPNGDGKNDQFGPVTISPVIIKYFSIYNRWGQLVHSSTDYWDGKFGGKDQPAGAYVYYIEAEHPDPTNPSAMITQKKEGTVVLLR